MNGKPNDMIFDPTGSMYICDMEEKAILTATETDGKPETSPIVKDYEGKPLLGPNSVALNESSNYLYFTDSGPLSEAQFSEPKGSIFAADLDIMILKPIALNCLAYPSGIALTNDGSCIFVAETLKNRILRLAP
jgi:sugar lactone lactonase YvrE